MTVDSGLRARQEAWLRIHGLALLIRPASRARGALARSAPWLAMWVVFDISTLLLMRALPQDQIVADDLDLTPAGITLMTVALVLLLLMVPVGVLVAKAVREASGAVRSAMVWGIAALALAGIPVLFSVAMPGGLVASDVWPRPLYFLGALLLAFVHAGSLLAWVGRQVVRELASLGPMAARVLPLVMLTMLLVFFTTELWQVLAKLPVDRVLILVGLVVLLVIVLISTGAYDAVDEVWRDGRPNPELLVGTPFEDHEMDAPTSPLSRLERMNLVAVPGAVLAVQTLLFALLAGGFFFTVGMVAVPRDVIASWIEQPSVNLTVGRLVLPIDSTLVRVTAFLGAVAGLSFAASNITDQQYRGLFFARAIEDLRRGVAARHVYRDAGRGGGQAVG